jgi:hypothetical protein
MKHIGTLCALVALCIAVVFKIELSRTRARLAAAQESIGKMQLHYVPVTELSLAREAAKAADAKIAALEEEVRSDKQTLHETQEQLKLASDRLSAAAAKPRMTKGSYSLVDGTIVYGPDAQLRLPNGAIISSPTGVMVSDPDLNHVDGDLVIETPGRIATTTNAFVSFEGGHMQIVAQSAVIQTK